MHMQCIPNVNAIWQLRSSMAPMKQISLRLSTTQRTTLLKLSDKLQIDQANVIRLAIARLAEQEGISTPAKR